jgi:hypothetical protein
MLKTVVSRKTPADGRPESLADRLASLELPLLLSVGGIEEMGQVEKMPCTCGKVASVGTHVHHFLAGEILKSLPAEANVNLAVDVDRGQVDIELD